MSTITRHTDRDDEAIDRVTQTLRAVAAATPIDSGPSRAPDGDVVLPPQATRRHPRRSWTVRTAVAAAAAAVLVAGVVWVRQDDGGDAPTDVVDQPASPPVHMEATWLPPALASTNGIIDRAPALGVPVEAAMWGAGDSVVAVAAADPGDDTNPDRVQMATARVGSALGDLVGGPEAEMPVTHVDGGRGAAVVAGPGAAVDARALAAVVASGTAPVDARPGESEPRRLPVDWLGGVGPTVTAVHQPTDQSASLGIVTVGGTLPDGGLVEALVPRAVPAEVRGHAGWQYPLQDGAVYAVTWQEQPGVVVTVAGSGLRPAEIGAVVDGLVAVEEPVGDTGSDLVEVGTLADRDYRIDAEQPADTGRGWCAVLTFGGDQVGRECERMVDGVTDGMRGLMPVASSGATEVWWGAVAADVATVTVDGTDIEAETIEVAPSTGGSGGLRVALVAVPGGRERTFRFHGAGGEDLGTATWTSDGTDSIPPPTPVAGGTGAPGG